ncbi:MAG TPA: hydrogenase iron-sulfur subunit [Symbiobacteriaceae bacterium]|nr:hydrogenase iron-sulfur subunit [Symbiobacteriaceae bacterium]
MTEFEPRIVGFFCNWCTYTAADTAGIARLQYPANVCPIRLMCSGRMEPTFVFKAFAEGADGVLIGGCHPGQCHYQEGNYKALRRVVLLKQVLAQMGIEPERLRLEWISGAEAPKLAAVAKDFTETVRALGPLGNVRNRLKDLDPELYAGDEPAVVEEVAAHD